MEYPLSITSHVDTDAQGRKLRSPITSVLAEADLGQYSEFGFPDVFTGRLVDVPVEHILDFKFSPGVEVVFRGSGYEFEEIEKDGTFKLRRGAKGSVITRQSTAQDQHMTIHNITYFIGAGLSKSLQGGALPIPAMWDFTATMADYLHDDVVLTAMALLENARLYEHKSDDAESIAARLVDSSTDRSPVVREAFREALKKRRPESIENLLERSLRLSGSQSAASAHQRFKYAINRLFCLVGWNVNLGPLEHFLQKQINQDATCHTFVSFNYDLILDFALQKMVSKWMPDTGYGFNIPYCVTDDPYPTGDGPGSSVRAVPFDCRARDNTVTILKPHGSLNWLVPYQVPYVQSSRGIEFLDSPPTIPLTKEGRLCYWCSTEIFQYIQLPNQRPSDFGICILPPSPEKLSELSFIKASCEAEFNALVTADEVVVIGWSVPDTDIDQAELIKRAVSRRSKPIQSLTIVNWKASRAYFERLACLFRVDSRALHIHNAGFVDFAASQ
jgi:hypothetical protein